jgi:hypothetical protein
MPMSLSIVDFSGALIATNNHHHDISHFGQAIAFWNGINNLSSPNLEAIR